MPKSPEQFNFSLQRDQEKFDKLPVGEKAKVIDKAHEGAVKENEIRKDFDSLLKDKFDKVPKTPLRGFFSTLPGVDSLVIDKVPSSDNPEHLAIILYKEDDQNNTEKHWTFSLDKKGDI